VHDAAPYGYCHGLGTVVYREFHEDILDVSLRGAFADPELPGHLPVPHPLGDQPRDFK
jgi:hypothetical protein